MKKLFSYVFVLILAACMGFAFSNATLQDGDESDDTEAATANQRVSDKCMVQYEYYYTYCGHTLNVIDDVPSSWVGLTKSQLEQVVGGVESFSPDLIKIKKTYEMYCDRHYILKKQLAFYVVLQTKTGTNEQKAIKTYLYIGVRSEEEMQALIAGKVFGSMEEVEEYVANLKEDDYNNE